MPSRIPPHLAEPQLTYASEEDSSSYAQAISRGFHQDFVAEHWEAEKKVLEWDRSFGLKVEDRWIATCGAFSRTLSVPGGEVPVAAVSIVTVAPAYRRRRLLTRMMQHQLEDVQRRGEPLALLWASESLIYGRFGYGSATPRLRVSGATRSTAFLPSVAAFSTASGWPQPACETTRRSLRSLAPRQARRIGDVVGIHVVDGKLPGSDDYFQNIESSIGGWGAWSSGRTPAPSSGRIVCRAAMT